MTTVLENAPAAEAGDEIAIARLVQCVGTVFSPIVPLDVHATDSFLVVIVRDMSIDELRSVQPPLPFMLKTGVREQAARGRSLGIALKEACA